MLSLFSYPRHAIEKLIQLVALASGGCAKSGSCLSGVFAILDHRGKLI
jgi:hypothetical protein